MGHPLPDEDFERGVPSRPPARDPGRPEWLTRANDHAGAESPAPGSGAHAPDVHRPRPAGPSPAHVSHPPAGAGPQRPGTWPAAGGVPKLETDSILSAHVQNLGSAGPAEPGSWEGTVKQVARTAKFPGDASQRHSSGGGAGSGFGLQAALALLSSPRVRLVAVVVVLSVVAIVLRPKGKDDTISISAIRHHPERFDGRAVKIKGRVGEVFVVGGGYAFYLHQGRDTMVVFSRSRVPVRREEVTIAGSISNGILDGKSRQALFETAH